MSSPATDFADLPPFEILAPAEQRVPFVFNSPHSGNVYPERFLEMSRLDARAIRRSEDSFVDELYAPVVRLGAPLLKANFPRAYLDANREPWELDPRMFTDTLPSFVNARSARVAGGLGSVPRIVGEGQEIYGHKLPFAEAVERIELYYKPYHNALRGLLSATHRQFGFAVLIDCHSMPGSIRIADNQPQPDFIIGDRFGVSAGSGLSAATIEKLTQLGYKVAHNKPYAGGFITEYYGRPLRSVHAIQIEVSRRLYMNERTGERNGGFAELQANLMRLVADLMALPDDYYHTMPLAAE